MSVVKMSRLSKEPRPYGCEYWVQEYAARVPRIEVFRFTGFDACTGLYWFQSIRENAVVGRNIYQLAEGAKTGFKPFLLKGGKA